MGSEPLARADDPAGFQQCGTPGKAICIAAKGTTAVAGTLQARWRDEHWGRARESLRTGRHPVAWKDRVQILPHTNLGEESGSSISSPGTLLSQFPSPPENCLAELDALLLPHTAAQAG